jgi:DNA-binding transcriptional ArsR family regulator
VNYQAMLDRSFVALSHPLRREIVARLARGPASVGDATAGLGVTKPAVTKHVKALEEAGLVRRSVEGRRHVLALEPRPLADAAHWLDVHRALWEAKLDAVAEHLSVEDP